MLNNESEKNLCGVLKNEEQLITALDAEVGSEFEHQRDTDHQGIGRSGDTLKERDFEENI